MLSRGREETDGHHGKQERIAVYTIDCVTVAEFSGRFQSCCLNPRLSLRLGSAAFPIKKLCLQQLAQTSLQKNGLVQQIKGTGRRTALIDLAVILVR